jgi:protein arginine kinase
MEEFMAVKGSDSDIAISSRVRLARNFKEVPFPFKMNYEQGIMILNKVKESFFEDDSQRNFHFIGVNDMNPINKQAMVEKHLISKELAESTGERGVLLREDEKISIMINEEDHLRIQCILPGMQLDHAWELCNKIDSEIEGKNEFAFDKNYGYLTCCPTNIGTGIRTSVMLHLPALSLTGHIKGVLEACSKLGMAVRGLYGENSEASGNMFQISNQVTLGQSEENILRNTQNIASQIIEQERLHRNELYKRNTVKFEDKVFRSLGIFLHARLISLEESMRLISDVMLGVDMGIIKNINRMVLNDLMVIIQPANLQMACGNIQSPETIDTKRAEWIREKLG